MTTNLNLKDFTDSYFLNPRYTELTQLIVSFTFGVIFAPFSYGAAFLIAYLIVYELAYAYFTNLQAPYWNLFFRIAIVLAALFGWIVGRTITGWKNPFRTLPNEF